MHLSQRALAAELGISIRTVQNYEAGKFLPYRHLDSLSRLLGRSSSWLLYGRDHPETADVIARSRQQRRELLGNMKRLVELRDRLADSAGQNGGGPAL